MPQANVFHWIDGAGWLVLSGGKDDDVRAHALAKANADGGTVYISLGEAAPTVISEVERTLEDLEDLGARAGYIVDVMAEDDQTLHEKVADAGIVVISGGESVEQMRSALLGAAINGIRAAYTNGAVILAEGYGAAIFGTWAWLDGEKTVSGVDWLKHALIIAPLGQAAPVHAILKAHPEGLALGIGAGSALALGPTGEIETWGKKQITITLGSHYQHNDRTP